MRFKVGDKVKYTGPKKKYLGCSGIIIRICPIIGSLCWVVKMPGGFVEHILTRRLKLNQKNQQLLFEFMER